MTSLTVQPCTDQQLWDQTVTAGGGHPLQLWGWGKTKENHGWAVTRLLVKDGSDVVASAQVLLKKLPAPFNSLAYIPRGPQGASGITADRADSSAGTMSEPLMAIADYVRAQHKSVALNVEPDWEDAADPVSAHGYAEALKRAGFAPSTNQILIPRTLILDLRLTLEELQSGMHKKHRQNIRKASRDELEYRVLKPEEMDQCLKIYRETAQRAGFGLHSDAYYKEVHRNFGEASEIHGAFFEGRLVAFLWQVASGRTSFEIYSGGTVEGQKLNVNYALKWFSIQRMKERGIERYDLDGLLNDGISEFKKGFATKHENMLVGTWEKPLSPLYPVFARALPLARRGFRLGRAAVKSVMGRIRRTR